MKKLILIFAFIILLIPLVFAGQQQDLYDLTLVNMHFDNAVNENNASIDTTSPSIIGNPIIQPGAKVGNGSTYFDGNEDALEWNAVAVHDIMPNMTIFLWYNASGTFGVLVAQANDAGGDVGDWQLYLVDGTPDFLRFLIYDDAQGAQGDTRLNNDAIANGLWHSVGLIRNTTGTTVSTYLYYDGLNVGTDSFTLSVSSSDDLAIGRYSEGGGIFTGRLDEVNIFNSSLTSDDIIFMNNSGRGMSIQPEAPTDTTPPTFNIPAPANNTVFNIIPLNFTINATDDISSSITCVLSNSSDIFDENTGTAGIHFNLTYDPVDANFQQSIIFNITCFDNDATNNNSAELFLNITLDNILPILTIISPINNSIIDKTFNNLSLNILCTDPNIIALNYSLIGMDGIVKDSLQNNTEGISMAFNTLRDISTIPTGNYNINVTCADGHTYFDSKVIYYTKDSLLNKVYYDTSSGNDISIQLIYSTLDLCDFGSKSATDREIFWYDFRSCHPESKETYTYKFMLRDNEDELRYLPKSNYKAHFVTAENFITFQLSSPASYSVKKTGKDYEITIRTSETYLDFKNSIGGNNFVKRFLNISITQTNYTSMNHFNFPAPTVTIDSDVFVPVFNISVNLSSGIHMDLRGSGVIKKVTQPQSTEVSGRLILNNEILFEGTIVSTDDVIPFNLPITHTEFSSNNNISLEIKESSAGAINLTYFLIQGNTEISADSGTIHHSYHNETILFASLSFVNIFNVSINKSLNYSSVIDIQHRVENAGVGATTLTCYVESNSTGEMSPSYYSYMQSNGDSGNAGIAYASQIEAGATETWMLYCKTDNGNAMINRLTGYSFALRDEAGRYINYFQNQSSSVSGLTAGETLILRSDDYQFKNSTELAIAITIAVQSTSGSHSGAMKFKINSTKISEDNCIGVSETGFLNSNDAKTVKFYFECEDISKGTIDLTAYATVATGETANILNVSMKGFEVTDQPLSVLNIPPMVVIISPLDNAKLKSIQRIEWITTDINSWTTNITAINSTHTTQIATDLGDDIANISFNFSTLGEGEFKINVTSTENLTSQRLSGTDTILITVQFNFISLNLTSPANNSADADGRVTFSFATDTSPNNCSLYIDNTINFINQSMDATVGTNSFSEISLENGTHTWLVRCDNSTHEAISDQWLINIEIPDPNALSMITCPNTTAGIFKLSLIVFIAITFITLALAFNLGFIGVFGSIMLMISSWFISPCSNIFAYAVGLLSILLMIYFIAKGFFGREKEI